MSYGPKGNTRRSFSECCGRRLGAISGLALVLALGAGAAGAAGLGLDVDVGIGGGDGVTAEVDLGIGRGDVVDAEVDVGIGGGNGVTADVDVGIGGGDIVDTDVDVAIGGGGGIDTGVGVSVGGGGVTTGVGVTVGGTPTVPGGGGVTPPPGGGGVTAPPGTTPPTPDSVFVKAPATGVLVPPMAKLVCAAGGNATAFNGFVLRDKTGVAVGIVHDATISLDQKLVGVSVQGANKSCYQLNGGSFRVGNGEVWSNVSAASFR